MRILLLLALLAGSLFAANTVDIAGPAAISSGSNILTISITTDGTSSGVQFTLTFPTSIQSFVATITGTGSSASKTVTCNNLLQNATTCVVVGPTNGGIISDGNIVSIDASASSPTGSQVFALSVPKGTGNTGTELVYSAGSDLVLSPVTSSAVGELSGKYRLRGKASAR